MYRYVGIDRCPLFGFGISRSKVKVTGIMQFNYFFLICQHLSVHSSNCIQTLVSINRCTLLILGPVGQNVKVTGSWKWDTIFWCLNLHRNDSLCETSVHLHETFLVEFFTWTSIGWRWRRLEIIKLVTDIKLELNQFHWTRLRFALSLTNQSLSWRVVKCFITSNLVFKIFLQKSLSHYQSIYIAKTTNMKYIHA